MRNLHELIHAYQMGTATPQQIAELSRRIGEDESAAREAAEWMLMEADLAETLQSDESEASKGSPDHTAGLRFPASHLMKIAAAFLLVASIVTFFALSGKQHKPQTPELIGWIIQPTGNPDFEILNGNHVRLNRGELHVSPDRSDLSPEDTVPNLTIETPQAKAFARSAQFLIGTHIPTENTGVTHTMKRLTRVLILAGAVTLTSSLGSVEGATNELLTAKADAAPTKFTVQANSAFAFDLYKQLSRENKGRNLFFSPYSISTALAMAGEGARGKTAEEMGAVLRYPHAAGRIGKDAQRLPWRMSLIHTGLANLDRKLFNRSQDPEQLAMRKKLVTLRAQLNTLNAQIKATRDRKIQVKASTIAGEINAINKKLHGYEISLANALWGEQTYPFKKTYINTLNKHYRTGGVFAVDFRNNYAAARKQINDWSARRTGGRIKNVMPERRQEDAKDLSLVLTNAIFFKADWKQPFNKHHSRPRPFKLADGKTIKVRTMHAGGFSIGRYGAFNADGSFFNTPVRIKRGQQTGLYPDANGFSLIELPYQSDDISMVVIAPNRADGLDELEQTITAKKLNTWISRMKGRPFHVYLPGFKVESDYKLGDHNQGRPTGTLVSMGMKRAFMKPQNGNRAESSDFSGMSDSYDQIYLGLVKHKAFVEINEKGTEAAAVTVIEGPVAPTSGFPRPKPTMVPFTPTFNANRPFIFLVREKSTGTVLFLGRIMQPAAAN